MTKRKSGNEFIQIRGAKTHNLKNIDIDIPVNKITCIAGPSGSGKSSLAFHTLLTESKRRLVNSFPTEFKFFWDIPNTVDVDSITPVLPAWGLAQSNPIIGSRPAVLDVMGVSPHIQKIFYYLGENSCLIHDQPFESASLLNELERWLAKVDDNEVMHVFLNQNDYLQHFSDEGIRPVRSIKENFKEVNNFQEEDAYWEVFRLKVKKLKDFDKKLEEMKLGSSGLALFCFLKGEGRLLELNSSDAKECPICGEKEKLEITSSQQLSPFNGLGSCSDCQGHGMKLIYDRQRLVKEPWKSIKEGAITFLNYSRFQYVQPSLHRVLKKHKISIDKPFEELPEKVWDILFEGEGAYPGFNELFEYLESKRYKKNVRIYMRTLQSEFLCESCYGARVSENVQNIRLDGISYSEFLRMNLNESCEVLQKIKKSQSKKKAEGWEYVKNILDQALESWKVALDLGLGHLNNSRKVKSLTASEYQRLLLVKYLSFQGAGSLFVFDEPSLGLGLTEQKKLDQYLKELTKQGNTVLLVDHSEFLHQKADHFVSMGPGAGELGGNLVFQGKYKKSLKKRKEIDLYKAKGKTKFLMMKKMKIRTLPEKDLKLPLNQLTWISGPSGSGKTSYVFDILANSLSYDLYGEKTSFEPYSYTDFSCPQDFEEVLIFNSTLGRTSSRSTVGSMSGLAAEVRKHYASLKISKDLGLDKGHFSSNSKLGQCPTCEGKGVQTIEMNFLEDVQLTCEDCQGMKLRPMYAKISDGRLSAFESFNKPMSDVIPELKLTPKFMRIWKLIKILRLDYLNLGRTVTSLSGGERQRLKLLTALQKEVKNSILFFENISIGLSRYELSEIGQFLQDLLKLGNTIIVVDQNPIFEEFSQKSIVFNSL